MTSDYRHSLQQRRVTTGDLFRAQRAWATFGQEMMARPLALYWSSGRRVADRLSREVAGARAPTSLADTVAQELANLTFGLMSVPASAARVAASRSDEAKTMESEAIEAALSGAAPSARARPVTLDPFLAEEQIHFLAGRARGMVLDFDPQSLRTRVAKSLLPPARILDASQGWASWFVPMDAARRLLKEAVELGHQPPEMTDAFKPVIVGGGEAMISLLATDYRASDFGVVREIGLTLSVTPRACVFPDPGEMFLRLIVTDPWSLGAARQVWGIRKDYWDTVGISPRAPIDVRYGTDKVRFGAKNLLPDSLPSAPTFDLSFPRFGAGCSEDVPRVIYSMVETGRAPGGPVAPARSILRRSGTREGAQFGGAVDVSLPASCEQGRDAGCLCSIGMACLCDTLRGLGLDRRRPAANGWSDYMSGTLEAPTWIDQGSGKSVAKADRRA